MRDPRGRMPDRPMSHDELSHLHLTPFQANTMSDNEYGDKAFLGLLMRASFTVELILKSNGHTHVCVQYIFSKYEKT